MDGLSGSTYNSSDDVVSWTAAIAENVSTIIADSPRHTAQCTLFRFILYAIVGVSMCLVGFFGNIVSYLVLQKDKSSPVASTLLQALAVADNAFLFLWLVHYPLHSLHTHFYGYDRDTRDHMRILLLYLRVYSFPLLYMTQTQTIWLTVIIAVNRYIAVCVPYSAPRLCTLVYVHREVVAVTVFSVLYNAPRFFEVRVTSHADNTTNWTRTDLGNDAHYQHVYTDGLYYVFSFILPLLILAFVNTKITVAYRATLKRRRRMTSRCCDNEKNITLVMIIVVVVFMLCQAPARIVQMVWGYKSKRCQDLIYYLTHITNTFEVFNSSVNFLIYFVFRKRFRDILCAHLCMETITFWRRPTTTTGATLTEGLSLIDIAQTSTTNRSDEMNTSVDAQNGFVQARPGRTKQSADEALLEDRSNNHSSIEVMNVAHQMEADV